MPGTVLGVGDTAVSMTRRSVLSWIVQPRGETNIKQAIIIVCIVRAQSKGICLSMGIGGGGAKPPQGGVLFALIRDKKVKRCTNSGYWQYNSDIITFHQWP